MYLMPCNYMDTKDIGVARQFAGKSQALDPMVERRSPNKYRRVDL